MSKQKEYEFHVIELMEPIDNEKYVCIPNSWIRVRETSDGPALVKFPVEELSEIKKRVMKQEFSEDWSVFLLDIKYSTDSYKDASYQIKILNKIFHQEQSSTKIVEDVPSSSEKEVLESQSSSETNNVRTTSTLNSDAEPVSKEIPKQLDFTNAEVRIGRKKSKVGTADSSPKARTYLTRQSLRMSLSGNNTVSLPDQTTKENLPKTSHCVEESEKTNNKQENEPSAKNPSELMRKSQIIIALRSVFGDDFKEILEQLHSKYDKNQLMLHKMRLAFMENCKIIKEFIELTNEVSNGPDISDTVSLPDQTTKENLPKTSHCVEESEKTNNNQENGPSAKNPSELMKKSQIIMALRSVFGDDFKEKLEQLHSKYDKNQLMLQKMRLAFMEHCKIIKELIELTNEVNNGPDISDIDSAVKELENSMMEVNINENNSDKATGSKVQNDTRKKEEKKHNSDDTEVKNNNPLNKIRGQARKFTLPPEYDPNDSRWTLKHREKKSGLVELLPHSRVYIDAIQLSHSKITSKDSKTLARSLLLEIFTENALSICSLTGKKANAYNFEGTSVRPGLDEHAREVLMNYVKKHAAEQNWVEFNSQLISNSIRNKMQLMRGKHQNIVEKKIRL